MTSSVLIAGGGIGGLAAALACAREGLDVTLLEQAERFAEVGAGLQLGPNAVRVLADWGLSEALAQVAAYPEVLRVCDAASARPLGRLTLGERVRQRYGQPYACVHRADLHGLLLAAVQRQGGVALHLGTRVQRHEALPDGVRVHTETGASRFEADALLAADGLWSRVRQHSDAQGAVRRSGHLAYRGLLPMDRVPAAAQGPQVVAWLGPRMHVVHYPVRRGECLNVVAVVHGELPGGEDASAWSHAARQADLMRALGPVHPQLADTLGAVSHWTLWALHDRAPETGPNHHAQGRVAWLGDAAHPLRPYLAQGAAMALEDAWTLGRLARGAHAADWPDRLQRYAGLRWARNARVQARSARNGTIFHASGPLRWGRNLAMAALGEGLLDNPWLYAGPPDPLA